MPFQEHREVEYEQKQEASTRNAYEERLVLEICLKAYMYNIYTYIPIYTYVQTYVHI